MCSNGLAQIQKWVDECISETQCHTFLRKNKEEKILVNSNNFEKKKKTYLSCIFRHLNSLLSLKVPSKICSRRYSNFFFFFFIFQRKQVLTFHMNCLPSRQFTWNVKACFLWKKKKKKKKMSSVAVVIGALRGNLSKTCNNLFFANFDVSKNVWMSGR